MLGSRTHEESGYLYTTQGPGASTSGGAGLPGVWSLGHTDPIPERALHFRVSQGDQSGRGAALSPSSLLRIIELRGLGRKQSVGAVREAASDVLGAAADLTA